MQKTKIIAIAVIIAAMAVVAAWYVDEANKKNAYNEGRELADESRMAKPSVSSDPEQPVNPKQPSELPPPHLSEEVAKKIAESGCIKGGEALGPGTYNENTYTWWFDANLNTVKEGCSPACVVDEKTKTVEINWRCTGVVPPVSGNAITNFEECAAAGNPVLETYPRQCSFNGQNFVEQIGKTETCSAESRKADVCAEILDPVCATVEIQCVKAPCDPVRQTFGNPCEACMNPLVKTYLAGECEEAN